MKWVINENKEGLLPNLLRTVWETPQEKPHKLICSNTRLFSRDHERGKSPYVAIPHLSLSSEQGKNSGMRGVPKQADFSFSAIGLARSEYLRKVSLLFFLTRSTKMCKYLVDYIYLPMLLHKWLIRLLRKESLK